MDDRTLEERFKHWNDESRAQLAELIADTELRRQTRALVDTLLDVAAEKSIPFLQALVAGLLEGALTDATGQAGPWRA